MFTFDIAENDDEDDEITFFFLEGCWPYPDDFTLFIFKGTATDAILFDFNLRATLLFPAYTTHTHTRMYIDVYRSTQDDT